MARVRKSWLAALPLLIFVMSFATLDAEAGGGDDRVARWIEELGNETFAVRESASAALWERGEKALSSLEVAADSPDPEVAFRARDLIRKIELGLTPDTREEILRLVEEYADSDPQKKLALVGRLLREKAYSQVLRLYAREQDPAARASLAGVVKETAQLAARLAIVDGRLAEAQRLLELAPADEAGLAALAAFHRSRGTLAAELERARTLPGEAGIRWRLALHRAAGNLEEALVEAVALGRPDIVAALQLIGGDPVPWLEAQTQGRDISVFQRIYAEGAAKRWRGGELDRRAVEDLTRAGREVAEERALAANALFALGAVDAAESLLAGAEETRRFSYFNQLERPDEALASLGLDPENPADEAWVREQLASAVVEDEERISGEERVLVLAEFLHQRGDLEGFARVMRPLWESKRDDPEALLSILGRLHNGGAFVALEPFVADYAGSREDPEGGWVEVVQTFYGEDLVVSRWWEYLGAGDDPPSLERRLAILESLFRESERPELAESWIERRREEAFAAAGPERDTGMEMLLRVSGLPAGLQRARWDLDLGIEVLREINEGSPAGHFGNLYLSFLMAGERWEEGADSCRALLEAHPTRLDVLVDLGLFLRNGGNGREGEELLERAELLTLGSPVMLKAMASAMQQAGDHVGAADCLRQILMESDPASTEWTEALQALGEYEIVARNWTVAAALKEATVFQFLSGASLYGNPVDIMMARIQADFARGMREHEEGNVGKAKMVLSRAARIAPGAGILADDFFPALREARLTALHDELFEESWAHLERARQRFPNAPNLLNTLAWMGSRACRRLDESEAHVERALRMFPRQPAFLDTRAEVCFARRNREEAIRWSERAVKAQPSDPLIRRQFYRFRHGEFPPL